jgi:predicted nucleotidyltransferase
MSAGTRAAVARLHAAVEDGRVAELARAYDLALLVLFGSAAADDQDPSDVDIAISFASGSERLLDLVADLTELTGANDLDVVDLASAGPVLREEALVTGRLLYQANPDEYARQQIAASMQRLDTDHFRRLDLELMAT